MTKVHEIVDYFASLVPNEMKMDFDNVGLLVGTSQAKVNKALIALDITDEVVDEAIREGAQLILSHHPLFFDLKTVNDQSPTGQKIVKLLQNGISALCQHTNLDNVDGGVNDALANAIGVSVCGRLEDTLLTSDGRAYGMGRIGYLNIPTSMSDYLSFLKSALKTGGLRYHDAKKPVYKLALCGGSGGDLISRAAVLGCDTLVTADVKYHQFLEAKELGLNLIDADHFCTENVVVPVLAQMLKDGFPHVEAVISKVHGQTVQFF